MKKLSKLKLNQLSKADLEKREMSQLIGGTACGCGCLGTSDTIDNSEANWTAGYAYSVGGDEKRCAEWGDDEWGPHW